MSATLFYELRSFYFAGDRAQRYGDGLVRAHERLMAGEDD